MDVSDWEKAFKMIELENTLANHRLSGLLKLQGFLFASFVLCCKSLCESNHVEDIFWLLAIIICLLGMYSSWVISRGLTAAYRQILAASYWLNKRDEERTKESSIKKYKDYPPIVGKPPNEDYEFPDPEPISKENIKSLSVGTFGLPNVLIGTWILFLFLIIGKL